MSQEKKYIMINNDINTAVNFVRLAVIRAINCDELYVKHYCPLYGNYAVNELKDMACQLREIQNLYFTEDEKKEE